MFNLFNRDIGISLNNKVVRQSLGLFGSSIAVVGIGFFIKYIQTHSLGEIDYGEYAFFTSLTSFLILFFRFGFFGSIQVLLAQNHNPVREKRLLAVGYIIAFINGLLMSGTIWLGSFLIEDLFHSNIGALIRIMSPLVFILPFRFIIGAYATGTNKIKIFSYFTFVPKLLYLLILVSLYLTEHLDLFNVILYNLVASLVYGVYLLLYLKPDFTSLRSTFSLVWKKNKQYGFYEYSGSVLSQSTYNLDQLFISHFINTVQLGFYSLATLICTPMVMMSQAVTRSMFRKYTSQKEIPNKILRYNTLWLIACVVFLFLFGKLIVSILFGNAFLQTADYILPLSAVFFMHGMYIPYGFMDAKSKGKEVRNTKITEAVVNILGNIALIPIYGVHGAIVTSFIAKLVHYLMIRYYYKKYLITVSEITEAS